jgi:hypothetical protein
MTEIEAPKPIFTRRRVLAGVVGLGLVLAAAGLMFGWFDQTPEVQVTASFAGFTRSTNDGSYLAMVRLTNMSRKTCYLGPLDEPGSAFGGVDIGVKSNEFLCATKSPRGTVTMSILLTPGSQTTQHVALPLSAERGRVAVSLFMSERRLPALLDKLRNSWRDLSQRRPQSWAVCDQEIQCPRLLPDGTFEPPRLLPAAERQR